ncbi:MAG TPA: dockerin type I domain-containing protein [Xanthomonadales bacterium]|nr:dockerin type I domain-containing protein [Xanthomonadales bacterium]
MKRPDIIPSFKSPHISIFFIILFFGLGFLVTGILNNQISKQKQIGTSRAQQSTPIQEASCTSQGGQCQSGKLNEIGKPCTLPNQTAGTVKYNFCPIQEGDIRCCVPNGAPSSASMIVEFQGIGPNLNPQNPIRTVIIKIFKDGGPYDRASYAAEDTLIYDPQSGKFTNSNFNLGVIPEGKYQMVLQEEKYLDVQLRSKNGDKVLSVSGSAVVEVSPVLMIAGDLAPGVRGDNSINIIDYNALIGCLPGAPINACFNRNYADLNDDGKVDQIDLDILMSNFGENGFAFQTDQFKCEPDPSCGLEKSALQLCSLLCTKKSLRS